MNIFSRIFQQPCIKANIFIQCRNYALIMMTEEQVAEIPKKLQEVNDKIVIASDARLPELKDLCQEPRLVAVSKTKPAKAVLTAYKCGQRHFGENYIHEIVAKGTDPDIIKQCPEIKWHVIGPVQSNKVKKVVSVPNIFLVETIHNEKIAKEFDRRWAELKKDHKLNVYIQVNTSGEENKSGVHPDNLSELVSYVINECTHLNFLGLMTIGAYDYVVSRDGPNPDFQALVKCRDDVCSKLSLSPSQVELSMGMSSDYEHAIEVGSFNVRVGSSIFGARPVKLA